MRKAIKVFLITAVICAAVFGLIKLYDSAGIGEGDYSSVELIYEQESESRFYYSRLSDSAKMAYTLVLPELYKHSPQIEIPKLSDSDFKSLMYALSYDNPDLICFSGECRLRRIGGRYYFVAGYTHSEGEHSAKMNELNSAADAIIKNLQRYSGEYEKELYIHDSVCRICRYDYNDNPDNSASNSWDALVKGEAVCEGYAKAVKLLLDRAGIKNYLVTGKAKGVNGKTEGHIWNVVTVQGENYHLDATWDDYDSTGTKDEIKYYFFNINDELIKRDHFDLEPENNSCQSLKKNYFKVNDALYENYGSLSGTRLAKAVCKAKVSGNNYCEMLFTDSDSYDRAVDELINQEKIFNVIKEAKGIDSSVRYTSVDYTTVAEAYYIRFDLK